MYNSKYSKYIVTDVKCNLELSSHRIEPEEVLSSPRSLPTPVMWLDGNVIPGAFYSEAVWIWPECASERTVAKAPTHPFDEIITFLEPTGRIHMICVEKLSCGWKMRSSL